MVLTTKEGGFAMKKKIKEFLSSKKMKVALILSAMVSVLSVSAFAEEPVSQTAAISTAMQSAMSTTVSETLSMISAILPTALSLVGAMLVVSLGIKAFKKITGKAG